MGHEAATSHLKVLVELRATDDDDHLMTQAVERKLLNWVIN